MSPEDKHCFWLTQVHTFADIPKEETQFWLNNKASGLFYIELGTNEGVLFVWGWFSKRRSATAMIFTVVQKYTENMLFLYNGRV